MWNVDCYIRLRPQVSAHRVRAERGGKVPMGGRGKGRKGKGPSGFVAAFADFMRGRQVLGGETWLVGM